MHSTCEVLTEWGLRGGSLCHAECLPFTRFNRRSIAVQWAANGCRRNDSCSLFAMGIDVSQAMRERHTRRRWSPGSCRVCHRLETVKGQSRCLSDPAPWQRTAPAAPDSRPLQRSVRVSASDRTVNACAIDHFVKTISTVHDIRYLLLTWIVIMNTVCKRWVMFGFAHLQMEDEASPSPRSKPRYTGQVRLCTARYRWGRSDSFRRLHFQLNNKKGATEVKANIAHSPFQLQPLWWTKWAPRGRTPPRGRKVSVRVRKHGRRRLLRRWGGESGLDRTWRAK